MKAPLVREGELNIRLRLSRGQVSDVAIHSTRPVRAASAFRGWAAEEVVQALPLVFSVCGVAQAVAGAQACESARGYAVAARQARARALLVAAETAREHLSRFFLEWPRWLGETPELPSARSAYHVLSTLRRALSRRDDPLAFGSQSVCVDTGQGMSACASLTSLLGSEVFGTSPAAWQQIADETELRAWAETTATTPARIVRQVLDEGWAAFGHSAVSALPALEESALIERLFGADWQRFVAQPSWTGEPKETSVFTRWRDAPLVVALVSRYGNGIVARLAARLLELASIPQVLREGLEIVAGAESEAERPVRTLGVGTGQVEAARGRLVHCAEIEDGRVCRYRILAPTEWNFHPRGPFVEGVREERVLERTRLERQLAAFIGAVDPCVTYRVTVGE